MEPVNNWINSIEPDKDEVKTKPGGLGLRNVIKRLGILYKGKYTFESKRLEDVFVVNLKVCDRLPVKTSVI